MSFSLKLDVSAENITCACSITDVILEKVKALHDSIKMLKEVEVRLFESKYNNQKGVTLSIYTPYETIVESSNSRNWEDAVLTAYENVMSYFRKPIFEGSTI
ncbi:MAG: hypothetical protein JWQ96_3088 [Segetibacter sp.]|nr:hypothetical protein [Segetibacter sp.]